MRKTKLWCYVLIASLILGGLICLPNDAYLLHARSSDQDEEVYISKWELLQEESVSQKQTSLPTITMTPNYDTQTSRTTREPLLRTIAPIETLKPIKTITPIRTLAQTSTPTPIRTIAPIRTLARTSTPTPKPTITPTSTSKPTITPTSTPKPTITLTPTITSTLTPAPAKTQLSTQSSATPTGSSIKIVPTPKVTGVDMPNNTSGDLESNPVSSPEVIEESEEIPNAIQQIVQRFYVGVKYYYTNDVKNEMDTAPVIKDGRTLLPIRYVSETFGAKVDWDGKEEKVSISFGDKTVELWIGKDAAMVDGTLKRLDVAPEIIEDRTVLPLRFVSESLGLKVEWDEDLREIKLSN